MESAALLYSALIAPSISLVVAALALAHSLRASRSTPARKRPERSPDTCLAELDSALSAEKISHQLQKLENRLRMREVRDGKRSAEAPAQGASKGELYRHYGFTQSGPAFAQHQLDLERNQKLNGKG